MTEYLVTDKETGQKYKFTGDGPPPTDAEIETELGTQGESLSVGAAGGLKFSETFVNNLLGLPRASGDVLALGAAALPGGEGSVREQTETQKGKFPASLLRKIPAPTFNQVGAGIRGVQGLFGMGSMTESLGDRFDREKRNLEGAGAAAEAAHPIATGVGDVAGDVATLLAGRIPASKPMLKLEKLITGKPGQSLSAGIRSLSAGPRLANIPKDFITSPTMRSLGRAAGRSTEAGAEAMVLDIVKGDDPFETAGWVAGSQLAGSGMLTLGKGLLSGGPQSAGIKLWLAAASTAALIQTLKTTVPGGSNSVIGSVEEGFGKVTFTMALAAAAGLVGSGRLRGQGTVAVNAPRIADAIAAIPRAAAISLAEGWLDAPEPERQRIEAELQKQMDDALRTATAPPDLRPKPDLNRRHPAIF